MNVFVSALVSFLIAMKIVMFVVSVKQHKNSVAATMVIEIFIIFLLIFDKR